MVGAGISSGGRTDFHVIANGTLTAVGYRDEILRWVTVRLYTGAVGPGFLLVQDNVQPHMARVCKQFLDEKRVISLTGPLVPLS